jgi:dTDP-4-amino-4,6-dideoxygalactose transaminase
MEIPFYNLKNLTERHGEAIKAAVGRVIDNGWFLLGQEVETFERHYAAYIGTKHCIGVANGLDALRLIIRAYKELGQLNDGDDILVPANTYIATILAITDNRLNPVLVEPNPQTLQIDETRLDAALTSKTKAVMIVHLYGQNAWTETIAAFCDTNQLLLLEDNAQAAGCVVKQSHTRQKTGSLGHAAGHSFYPTKPLGALGDGGAVTTNDDQLATTIRSLANYGSSRKYVFPYQGYNSRLDELQAATLDLKLRHLDSENEHRRSIARQYRHGLNHPAVELPALSLNDDNVYHLFPILVKENFTSGREQAINNPSSVRVSSFRDALQQYLAKQGIQTQIHYPIPPHKQACYKSWNDRQYPITEAIHNCELSLPISPVMTFDEVERIINTINHWIPTRRPDSIPGMDSSK